MGSKTTIGLTIVGAVVGGLTGNPGLGPMLTSIGSKAAIGYMVGATITAYNYLKNQDITTDQQGIQVNVTSSEAPLPVLYGKSRIGINIVDIRQHPTNSDVIAIVGTIGLAPEGSASVQGINEVSKIYFDEELAIDGPSFPANSSGNNPTSAGVQSAFGTAGGTFGTNVYLEYMLHDGDDDQAYDFYLNDVFSSSGTADGAWGTQSKGKGIAYAVFWLWYKDDVFVNGLPNINMELEGNKVADVTDLSAAFAYSTNPVDCIYDYLTSTRYGLGIPAADIDAGQTTLQANPITTASGSTVITVADSSALSTSVGGLVTLSGAADVGGIVAARLNVEMTVVSMVSDTSFTADLGGANASSTATGGGSSVKFDASSFTSAANYCDESVDVGHETLADRFTCNGFLLSSAPPLTNLQRLLTACNGRLVREGTLYKLLIRRVTAAQAFELNTSNIVGDWTFARSGIDDTANLITATYVDVDQNWQPQTSTFPSPGDTNSYLSDDGGYLVQMDVDLPFTENEYMSVMIAAQVLLETRADMACTLVAQREALKLSCGDVVNVTHPTPNWTSQPCWVEEVAIRNDGMVELQLKEYVAATYTVPSMKVRIALVAASLPGNYDTDIDPEPQS